MYMAPEQVVTSAAGPASDLFSLGGVLYALATGQPPFKGDTLLGILDQVRACQPIAPRQLRPDLPKWLEDIIQHLLRKDPKDRIRSATELTKVLAESR